MKKYLTWAGAAFAAYYLAKSPGAAARIVHNTADSLASAGDSLTHFVNAL